MATVDTLQINIESNADSAVAGIDRLSSSLRSLGTTAKSVGGNSFKGLSNGLVSVNSGLVKSTSLTKSLTSAVSGLVLKYMGLRAVLGGIKKSIDLSSDLTEQNNVVYTVFGEYANQVEELAKTSNQMLGLSELTVKQLASHFQQLGTSMGIAQKDAAEMSVTLTKLSADAGSMFNKDAETMMSALRSIYTGQTKPIQNNLGIDIRQSAMDAYLLSQGIDRTFASMTAGEKAAVRYQYVLEKLNYTSGDFAKTSNTWANQVRILGEAFKSLGTIVGTVFISAFKPVIATLNKIVTAVTSFVKMIADALGAIFGWTIEISTAGIADNIDDIGGGLSDAATGAGDTAGGLGDANKQAKELKKTILGFDELNVLNGDNPAASAGGGAGGGGGGGGAGGAADGLSYSLVHAESIFEKYKSDITTLNGLGNAIRDALISEMESIDWPRVYGSFARFGSGLADFLNGLFANDKNGNNIFGELGTTVAGAINSAIIGADAFAKTFDFEQLGKALSDGVVNAVNGIKWPTTIQAASHWGDGVATTLKNFLNKTSFKAVGTYIAQKLNTALAFIDSFGTTFFGPDHGKKFGESIATGINTAVSTFNWKKLGSTFNTWAWGILGTVVSALEGTDWKKVGTSVSVALQQIQWSKLLSGVGTAIWTAINSVIDLASGVFDGDKISNPISGSISSVLESIKTAVDKFKRECDIKGLTTSIGELAVALEPFVSGFVGGLGEGFTNIVNGLGDIIKNLADLIKDLPPSTLEKLGEAFGKFAAAVLTLNTIKNFTLIGKGISSISKGFGDLAGIKLGKILLIIGALEKYYDLIADFAKDDAENLWDFAGLEGPERTVTENTAKYYAKENPDRPDPRNTGESLGLLDSVQGMMDKQTWSFLREEVENTDGSLDNFKKTASVVYDVLDKNGKLTSDWSGYFSDLGVNGKSAELGVQGLFDKTGNFVGIIGKNGISGIKYTSEYIESLGENSSSSSEKLGFLSGKIREAIPGIDNLNFYSGNTNSSIKKLGENSVTTGNGMTTFSKLMRVSGEEAQGSAKSIADIASRVASVGSDFKSGAKETKKYASETGKIPKKVDVADKSIKNFGDDAKTANDKFYDFNGLLTSSKVNYKNVTEQVKNVTDKIKTAGDTSKDTEGFVSSLDRVMGVFANNSSSNKSKLSELSSAGDSIKTSFGGADEKVSSAKSTIETFVKNVSGYASSAKTNTQTIGSSIISGITDGLSDSTKTSTLFNKAKSIADDIASKFNISESMKKSGTTALSEFTSGLKTTSDSGKKYDYVEAVNNIVGKVKSHFSLNLESKGKEATNSYTRGINSPQANKNISSTVSTFVNQFVSGWVQRGKEIASSIGTGMKTMGLPKVSTIVSSVSKFVNKLFGNVSVPDISFRWFAKGGLFDGPQLIGVGEAGKEAVLPLTNRRAMNDIASSITKDMGGTNMETAVYRGMMAANNDSKQANTNVNITLEGDADKMFRVVQDRGRIYQRSTGREVFA